MIDYETLKQAWIKQGYDFSAIPPKDLDKRKTIDGKFYSIIPPLEYEEWKERSFTHFDIKALADLTINDYPTSLKNILNSKYLIPYIQNFASDITLDNAKHIIESILGVKSVEDIPRAGLHLPTPEQFVKAAHAGDILGYLGDIVASEVGIFECDADHASPFALYIVDLKHERKCPIKNCTHGRKCIIESKTFKADKTIIWKNNKGIEKEYLLRAKECRNKKQPYMVITDYNASVIFDYLFHLKEEKCPLCDSDNKRPSVKNRYFKYFKCLQCGNEFKVYNGAWYHDDYSLNIDSRLLPLHMKYLRGCMILGISPKLFKKYKKICCRDNKEELMEFFKDINIQNKKGLFSSLYKEIERIKHNTFDLREKVWFQEYTAIIKEMKDNI